MNTTLIVLAHPNRASFNGAWADATGAACRAAGHTVLWSDLCGDGFDPVESPRHYTGGEDKLGFDPLRAQERAFDTARLPGDIETEIDKIRRADRIVFHFPLWWFAPPAILKGWFDRVLAHGALHDVDRRFDSGLCRGKRALMCVTTGATAAETAPDGKEGDFTLLLWPTAYTLRYLGFEVLMPLGVHGVHGYHQGAARVALQTRLAAVLDAQGDRIAGFDDLPLMRFNPDSDFDDEGRLRPDRPSHSPFIRHRP